MNAVAKLYKLAYVLDKKSMFDEAREIERVMEAMAQRMGIKLEDMVALADHFDQVGETVLADKFDQMAKEAKKK